MDTDIYLRIDEVAKRLGLSPKSVRNKMAAGVFCKGVHYFAPQGMYPRFSWAAIEAWMREEAPAADLTADDDAIPMSRGYKLGR